MPTTHFDPYAAQARLLWSNRVSQWRAQPGEAGFNAAAWLAMLGALGWIAARQLDSLAAGLIWLRTQQPLLALALAALCSLLDQWQSRRRQRRVLATHWLSAQPVSASVLWRRRWLSCAGRMLAAAGAAAPLLVMAQGNGDDALMLAACCLPAAILGNRLGDIDRPTRLRRRRETAFTSHGVGSIPRWQWIEAGASLAPFRLAPMLLLIVLVPRGPAALAVIALALVMLATAINGWLRGVWVFVLAENWLGVQPLSTRTWLLPAIRLPLLQLLVASLALALLAMANDARVLAILLGVGLPMIGCLYLAVVASGRAMPRRVPLRFGVQLTVLIASSQAFAPLMPAVWLIQMVVLLRRSLR